MFKKNIKPIAKIIVGVIVAVTILSYAVDYMGGVGKKIKNLFDN